MQSMVVQHFSGVIGFLWSRSMRCLSAYASSSSNDFCDLSRVKDCPINMCIIPFQASAKLEHDTIPFSCS